MRRRGPKGRGDFERISWDEALDEIAERLAGTIRDVGPEAIWPYVGSGSMGLLQGVYGAGRRLWNALGASQPPDDDLHDRRRASAPATRSATTAWGWIRRRCASRKLIILWGSNTLTTNHHLWRSITTARQAGRAPRRDRPGPDADRRRRGQPPGADSRAPTPRWRWASCTSCSPRARRTRTSSASTRSAGTAFRARILEYPPDRVAEICGLPAPGHRRARDSGSRTPGPPGSG